jgi:Uma2 family endonuclease
MTVPAVSHLTPEEYLALERGSELRHEYVDGRMVAMTGGSRNHALIVTNLGGELRQQLKGRPCEVYTSDLRVQVSATGLYSYPDVVVVCGEPRFEDPYLDTLLNPTVIIEVLSPTTEPYDRGRTFEQYRTLESLREYLLISQDHPLVEQFLRQEADAWLLKATAGFGEVVSLPSVQCEIASRRSTTRSPSRLLTCLKAAATTRTGRSSSIGVTSAGLPVARVPR